VGLRVSAMVQSPVVIGAWRPLVLVPVGMLTGLPAAQVEALLMHELAHIRRHDYLVNLLQSVAEALLFYHPAVWWVSSQIRKERECCCDDAAVAVSGDVMEYVNALAELASSRPMRLAAVAANGGSLADRIARLLGERRPAPGKRGTVLAVVLLAAATYGVFAQDAPRPSFQVASVKRTPKIHRTEWFFPLCPAAA
jgi:beta-lactamase regulating signal transducer with metallopeptidase domain